VYVGGGSGIGLGVLIVWAATFWNINMPAEVAAVVGSLALGAGAAVGSYGIKGCICRLWDGKPVQMVRAAARAVDPE
jgi:hypothetical protein